MSDKSKEVNPTDGDPDLAAARASPYLRQMQEWLRMFVEGAIYRSRIPRTVVCIAMRDEIVRIMTDDELPLSARARADVAKELRTAIDLIAPETVWRPEPGEPR